MRLIACLVMCSTAGAGVVEYVGPIDENGQGYGNRDTILTFENRKPSDGTVTGGVGVNGTWGDAKANHSQTFSLDSLPKSSNGFSLIANVKGGWEVLDWMVVFVQDPFGSILDAAWYTVDTPIYGFGNGHSDAVFRVEYDDAEWSSWELDGNRIGVAASFASANGGESISIAPISIAPTPAAVPEPGSLVLLSMGLAGLGAWRYRKRRNAISQT